MASSAAQLVPLQVPSFTQLSQHNSDELSALLMRADDLARASNFSPIEPVTFVLHGDEINLFKRDNYQSNQMLVDLAARLDAFKVIDVRVCETWLRDNQVAATDLPPFVELVPFGPSFQAGLQQSGAIPF
ncbi:MAG: hypothetical protein ACPGUF_08385 [Litorivicinus sp.]